MTLRSNKLFATPAEKRAAFIVGREDAELGRASKFVAAGSCITATAACSYPAAWSYDERVEYLRGYASVLR